MSDDSRDFADFYLAVIALWMGALFVYWGGRGLLAYFGGIRAAWTEPWVCLLGLNAGSWMLLMSLRLFRGPGPHRQTLLSQGELLVLSLGVLAGSIWALTFAPAGQAFAFLGIGVAGLGRWWIVQRAG